MSSELKQGFADPGDFIEANDLFELLVDRRGGCRCYDRPPCSACSEPLTEDEADELGWIKPEAEQAEARRPPLTWAAPANFDPFARPVIDGHAPMREWTMKSATPPQQAEGGGE